MDETGDAARRAKHAKRRYYDNHDFYKARNKLRYEVRMGRVVPADRCEKCDAETKTVGHFEDPAQPTVDLTWLCMKCYLVLHPKKIVVPTRAPGVDGEFVRKLPPYDVLRRHLVDEGKSYGEIGELYGVGRSCVFRTIKDRAVRRDDWPLPLGDHLERKARGMARARPTTFARGLAEDVWSVCRDYEISVAQVAGEARLSPLYLQDKLRSGARMHQRYYDRVARALDRLRERYAEIGYHQRVEEMRRYMQELVRTSRRGRSVHALLELAHVHQSPSISLFVAGRKRTVALPLLEKLEAGRALLDQIE